MKKTMLQLILLAVCLLFAACGEDTPEPGTEPTAPTVVFDIGDAVFTKSQVVLTEAVDGLGAPFALNMNLEITEFCGVTYGFEPGIPMAEREVCIWVTETVRSWVQPDKSLRIYVYTAETYGYDFVENGAVYTYLQNWESPEYLAVLLQGIFGEYCHYGAAYGYGSFLGNRMFKMPANLCDDNWAFSGDENILDLNLLCFRGTLVDGKDVKQAKKLANTFAAKYIGKHGEGAYQRLLSQSGSLDSMDVFLVALSDFYNSLSITHTPSNLIFRQGGKGYDYILKSPYGVFFMEGDWKDRNPAQLPMYYKGFLHRNYSEIIEYFTTIIREMGQYQALFGLDSYRNDLKIYYSNHYGNGKSAVYISNVHSVCSPYGDLAMYYIESLIQNRILPETWAHNGTITYFYWYYNLYGTRDKNYIANLESDHSALRFYREFRNWLGREIDMVTDFSDMIHYNAATKNYEDPNKGSSDSFVGYLVCRYGERQAIDILLRTHNFGEVNFNELVADWKLFLKTNYGQ